MSAQRSKSLGEAVRTYNDGVRWQRFQVAATHLPPTERDGFLDQRDRLHEDLRVNDYEVIRVRYDESGERARVQVKVWWHLDSLGTVHDTHVVQTWQRHGKDWLLMGEKHLRGEPMPGMGDPKDAPSDGEDAADSMRDAGN